MPLGITRLFFLKALGLVLIIIYAGVVLASTAAESIKTNDPKPFLIDGLGQLITGADREMYDSVEEIKVTESRLDQLLLMFNGFGALLLTIYILWGVVKIQQLFFTPDMNPKLAFWIWAVVIIFILQTLFNSVVASAEAGTIVIEVGYSGLVHFLVNMDVVFSPVRDFVENTLGDFILFNPFI